MGTKPKLLFLFIFLGLESVLPDFYSSIATVHEIPQRKLADAHCPMNFDVLREIAIKTSVRLVFNDIPTECRYLFSTIRLVRSEYLRTTGFFLPPPNASEACMDSYQALIGEFVPGFDVRITCGFHTSLFSEGCMNITTASQFEGLIPESKLREIRHFCNQSLEDTSSCTSCTRSLLTIQPSYLRGPDINNVSDCNGYPFMYAAALANQFWPTDLATVKCLFSLDYGSYRTSKKRNKVLMFGVPMGCVNGFLGAVLVVLFLWRRHKKWRKWKKSLAHISMGSVSGLETVSGSTTLVRFTFEEIKNATGNFSRENLIGKGGYGNVYKGILPDGSEVALKRFKNCSAAGDASFTHEVEVIASVRHVNLVGLRGYCTEIIPLERPPENNCV
ncbi:hypothetical protein L1049_019974 [Liquidambar formosana]|uniref:Protein kinase domain-containing protein n=1 Tax=Liquidambar formosana TaxID=63359 RepID=A0AAP0SCG5_LIQFO